MIHVTPVILCGGSGTRLWPLSRAGFPKQFLCLTGNESLFQLSVKRSLLLGNDAIAIADPIVVSNEEHRFLLAEQLREIGVSAGAALLEPESKNTAPALTLAALEACAEGQDPVLVVTPSDQVIEDSDAFTTAMRTAIHEAVKGGIVVLGIRPDQPATGYGYIRAGATRPDGVLEVREFVEKPDAATAQRYLADGGYFWNAGIFVVKASTWLRAIAEFRADISLATSTAWSDSSREVSLGARFVRPAKAAFHDIPAESVDYAVIERCPGSAYAMTMVPLDAGWSDLGSWDAVLEASPKDESGNACVGDVLTTGTKRSLVHASHRLVALVGVEDMIVVETADAVLVANRSRSQDVKHIVGALAQKDREEHALHRKVHRPWGWYDTVDTGRRFQVKRIQVRPGASLSLQKHHHRAEHWIVVKGTAEVVVGEATKVLTENQSVHIPLGEVHRLTNPGKIPLEIIEVQSGSYLGEDDIVRFEDTYGRTP
ncbi:mannose-1-phosphate guanylyltransferase/mannose-6-phosphate isomerase [Pandoraea sp. NPDC090278]|uniref:mannose-1-phosphate guanylyltransferase/mannose-6-phosphate isomerase n=1 Tax=Pandoraea sp. NPDC090278 TaxID=3364391 RepID=UPI00383AE0A1